MLAAAQKNNLHFIYNAKYCSYLNPIEMLWNRAKFSFKKECITVKNYSNVKFIMKLIKESIQNVP